MTALALSIRQPWAWAIVHAGKDIENRTWSTRYRGPVFIHAGVAFDGPKAEALEDAQKWALSAGVDIPWSLDDLPRGGIVGVAEIVDCVTSSRSPWFMGQYGFVLRNARPIDFIPCKGALGFFRPACELPAI
ncbi:MAG: ASCH domain-containing protein [Beijerinckiaceae bacterium]|nr:ASCH domain-containing protein [Beijerinckiaceae bacterium]